ncbi:MAG: hypothetical protein ACREAY_05125 [Nitrososphaera sp.]|uniref:hypothetical protein n=1 Tax=Nitrososphaera sp. TaxID=1971748 RepID=UPI003D6FE7BA
MSPAILLIDECTKQQMYDLLASLDVQIEKMIADGWTVAQLREEYRAMLARQLRDWNLRKEYFNAIRIKAR